MTKSELEAKMSRLRNELDTIMSGHGAYHLLRQYAKDLGTGYTAFERAKDTVEMVIAQAEKDLAALPPPSKFKEIESDCFEQYGNEIHYMDALDTYIKALEACRPWVIRSKSTGVLARRLVSGDIALYSTKEIADKDCEDTGRTREWEVVQWEGNQ